MSLIISNFVVIIIIIAVIVAVMSGDDVRRRVVFDRVLGKGTFSTVFRALVKPDDQHIALKIVNLQDIIGDQKTVRDCINEINHLKVSVNRIIIT